MKLTSFFLLLLSALVCSAGEAQQNNNPYGVCAHVTRWEPYTKELPLMKQAGIGWARSDFDWCALEKKKGEWTFEYYDRMMNCLEANGIQILPIVTAPPGYAYPAHEHLDDWERFIRTIVGRYQNRIPVWEVWNEENIEGFWKNPNATNYCALLKRTYQTIKTVNPKLQVAFGGLAGTPLNYIEGVYQAGGKDAFDIMNVHPYSQPEEPEIRLEKRLRDVRAVMARHGDEKKPLWITEIGWPTMDIKFAVHGLYRAALTAVDPKRKNWRVALLEDSEFLSIPSGERDAYEWPENSYVRSMEIKELLDAMERKDVDVVMLSIGENFPADLFDRMFAFVKDGGVWIQPGGMPLWNSYRRNPETDRWERKPKDDAPWKCRKRLRVGVEAWWTNHKIPKKMSVTTTAAGQGIRVNDLFMDNRYFLPDGLKEGDSFIPLLIGTNNGYTATAAAVYKYNSDLKGAFVTCGVIDHSARGSTEEKQGKMLPRSAMISFRSGVDRFFWYEFQAPEKDDVDGESHFGMVHSNLQPKPAYAAYWTLISHRPAASRELTELAWKAEKDTLYFPQWKRPDGKIAGAIWKIQSKGVYRLTFESGKVRFSTHTGRILNPVRESDGTSFILRVSGAPLYFTGAKLLSARILE